MHVQFHFEQIWVEFYYVKMSRQVLSNYYFESNDEAKKQLTEDDLSFRSISKGGKKSGDVSASKE